MRKSFNTLIGISLLATIMLLAASCKKEDFKDDPDVLGVQRNINTSAGLPQTSDKAYLDYNDGRKVKWNDGDAININGTVLTASAIDNSAENPRATFSGTVYALKEATNNNDVYWAAYPYIISGEYEGGIPQDFTTSSLTFTLPDTQIYNANNRSLQDYTFMAGRSSVAEGANPSFQMRNLGAVMKVHLQTASGITDTRVSKIEFSSTSNNLSGKFSIDGSDNIAQGTGDGSLTVCLKEGNNDYIDIANGADVYVFLPPIAVRGNLTMKIYNTKGYMTTKVKASLSTAIDRNRIYTNDVTNISFSEYDIYYSVSSSSKVVFAPGNLQWNATGSHKTADGTTVNGTFRFAPNQWEMRSDDNRNIASNYTAGWIDLFGWGTSGWNSGANAYLPYSTSVLYTDYYVGGAYTNGLTGTYAKADWGRYNAIYNPKTGSTDKAGTWRLLTASEWRYLLETRRVVVNSAKKLSYGNALVNGSYGIILLPDQWNGKACSTFVYGGSSWSNVINGSAWAAMENAGCVFLPAAGNRYASIISNINTNGYYWTSTHYSAQTVYSVGLNSNYIGVQNVDPREYGFSVRLAKKYEK